MSSQWIDDTKAWVLVALIFIGSMALALIVPMGSLWALSHVNAEKTASFYLGLMGSTLALVAWAAVLGKLNAAYQQVTGRRDSNVLEMSLAAAVLAAVIVLLVLVFFYGGHDPLQAGPVPT